MSSWASSISLLFAATLAGVVWPADASQSLPRPAPAPKLLGEDASTTIPATPQMARQTATQMDDIALANRCVSDGLDKRDCLCVVKIMKHEMTLQGYRHDIRLYIERRPGAHMSPTIRQLASDAALADRCAAAHAFFFPGQTRR